MCACRARPTVSSLTQQYLNRASRRRLPHARCQLEHALFEAVVGARNRCSASSIKTRIFRDFSGSSKVWLVVMELPYFHKPLHFNEKYAYIE
jgi:hypothetical protein